MKRTILFFILILFISSCNSNEIFINENNKAFSETNNKEYRNYVECINSFEEIKRTEYDLFSYHNLTCEKIDFILLTWDSEISKEVEEYKLFGNEYKHVDYGVHKSLKLKKYIIINKPTLDNCSVTSQTITDIYRKKDYIKYYLKEC